MKKEELLEKLKADYKVAEEYWADNFKAAAEDIKFRVPGNQWPAEVRRQREADKLPCIEADKINQYIRQVVNDGRQNRPSVKVSPVDDGDIQVAEGFAGLIRSICDRSNADEAFDTALDHAAGNGFGWMRVYTDYSGDRSFNQEIGVRRVRNPLAVMLGPHYLADGSDAEFGFVTDNIPKSKYKTLYPKASVTNWEDSGFTDKWSDKDTVRIVEYFYKVDASVTMHELETGDVVDDETYQKDLKELGPENVPPIVKDAEGNPKTRVIPAQKVKWCRASGAEILEEQDWAGKYIPIIPVYGNEMDVEGKVIYFGLTRPAKDPQLLYNFSRSAFAQRVASTPKTPWLAEEGQIEGHEHIWEAANSGAHQVLPYKAVDIAGTPIPPPQRISPTDVPAGFAQDMQQAEHDIQSSMGMYAASIGERSNEKSGKAIMARQREGDTATFHYQDNLNRAIRYLGRILVDLIPKVYDSRRAARILSEDGSSQIVTIDPEAPKPYEKIPKKPQAEVIYNLGAGTYDVSISAGPSYTTKRQESAEAMIELVRANPQLWATHGDLIVKAQDWPGADEFAKRHKRTLPPELRDEEDGAVDPEIAALQGQLQQLEQQAQALLQEKDAELESLKQQLANKQGEISVKDKEADTKQFEADTERLQALAPAVTPELIQQIAQTTAQAVLQSLIAQVPQPPPPEPQPIEQPPPGGFFVPEGV